MTTCQEDERFCNRNDMQRCGRSVVSGLLGKVETTHMSGRTWSDAGRRMRRLVNWNCQTERQDGLD